LYIYIYIVIKAATKRISDINQEVITATTAEKENAITADLSPIISETNKKANFTKTLLQRLREETESLKNKGSKVSDTRIRENLVNTLTRKFVDIMKDYQNAQTKYKSDIKKKVTRQVQFVKEDVTPEEIDSIMRSGGRQEVYKQAILTGGAADVIRNTYINVRDKYQDVLVLEASVAELHQMFLDFALLTDQQGALLDQIEHHVKAASDYIEEGNKEMVEAIEIQKSIRKKHCCIIVIVLVIIGIIVAIILGTRPELVK